MGDYILDYIDARIVMDELVGSYSRHNTYKSFDMIIKNHCVPVAFHIFKDLILECLLYTDNSGGQVNITNLHSQAMDFLRPLVDVLDVRFYEATSYYRLYIDEEVDEKKILGLLKNLYGVNSNYAVS